MKLTLFLLLGLVTNLYASLDNNGYYDGHKTATLQNEELKDALQVIIDDQKVLSYKQARRVLFGDIDLKTDSSGNHTLVDTYCEETFGRSAGVGVNKIPNHTIINCEHTWPQSRFSRRHSSSAQKSDLHHLFPVKSVANSTRGNIPFGENNGENVKNCAASKRGRSLRGSGDTFEPSKYHKGNVARALFYFAVRYDLDISENEEKTLRQWNRLDPVDQEEIERHEKIYKIQGNRNPFIDDESLIDRIDNI